jgi:hypothetical protein
MASCTPIYPKLGHADRNFISWPTTGITSGGDFTVTVELERSGVQWPLTIGVDEAIGYFAGPDYPSPGLAHVVPTTSHCELHVVSSQVSVTLEGGFIVITR